MPWPTRSRTGLFSARPAYECVSTGGHARQKNQPSVIRRISFIQQP